MQESPDETSSEIIAQLYNKRKQVFLKSLQDILLKLTQDRIVKQMLQDRTSGQFITRRIEEIISQVITDDREAFIDILARKLNSYETLYSKEHSAKVRELGTRILSISDKQNAGEVHHMRQIQSLMEQVQALQAEVVTLRAANADKMVPIEDTNKSYLHLRTLEPDNNPSSPSFMHIFARVDLTNWQVTFRLIQTDVATTRELMMNLIMKMEKLFSIMKNKARQSAREYAKRVHAMERRSNTDSAKVEDVKRHYEEHVIPQLLLRHKDSVNKYKKMSQDNIDEIDKLKAELAQSQSDLKIMRQNNQKLELDNDSLNKRIAETDEKLASVTTENNKNSDRIQELSSKMQKQNDTISLIQNERNEAYNTIELLKQSNATLQSSLDETTKHNDSLENELQKMKVIVPRSERIIQDLNNTLEEARQHNNELSDTIKQKQKQIAELTRRVKKAEPLLETTQNELKETGKMLDTAVTENNEKKRMIEQLQHENEIQKQSITRFEAQQKELSLSEQQKSSLIESLAQEKEKQSSEITELEAQITKLTSDNERLQKSVKEQKRVNQRNATQIDAQTEENEQLRETVRQNGKKITQLENQVKQATVELENAHSEIEDLVQIREKNEKQMESDRDEKYDLKKKVRELNQQIHDLEGQTNKTVSESRKENKALRKENEEQAEKIIELDGALKATKKQKQLLEDQVASHERELAQIKQDKNIIQTRVEKASSKLDDYKKELEETTARCKTFQKMFDKIQAIAPNQINSMNDIPDLLKTLLNAKTLNDEITSVLPSSDPVQAIKDLQQKASILDQIQATMKTKNIDSLPSLISKLKEDHQRITEILGDSNPDLSVTIAEIIKKQGALDEQLKDAASFISRVLAIISGPSDTPLQLVFPLKQTVKDRLVDLVEKIKKRSADDRMQIEEVLQKARAMGYKGESLLEAANFISERLSETERQKTLEMINKELQDVRDAYEKEKEMHTKDKSKSKKRIAELKSSFAQMQAKFSGREEDLANQIQDLETKIRQLTEDLETERRVREELGRIGAGFSADSKYLRSKMTANELKLITFVEKMMQTEREGAELRKKQAEMREQLLGDAVAKSTSKSD